MTFANGCHLWRDEFHLGHAAIASRRQRKERKLDQDGQDDDGPAPVTEQFVDLLHQQKDWFGDDGEPAIVFDEIEVGCEFF